MEIQILQFMDSYSDMVLQFEESDWEIDIFCSVAFGIFCTLLCSLSLCPFSWLLLGEPFLDQAQTPCIDAAIKPS